MLGVAASVHTPAQDTQDILSDLRHQGQAISRVLREAQVPDDTMSDQLLTKAFQEQGQARHFFGRLLRQQGEAAALPLTESMLGEPIITPEDPKEKIEAEKVQRTQNAFVHALRGEADLWVLFLEHFRSEASFGEIVTRGKFAQALAGVMKMLVDWDALRAEGAKKARIKQESDLRERHRALLLTTSGTSIQQTPHGQSQAALLRQAASPRSETQNYELVLNSEQVENPSSVRFRGFGESSKKNLPSYDLARVQRLAQEAERQSKIREERPRGGVHAGGKAYTGQRDSHHELGGSRSRDKEIQRKISLDRPGSPGKRSDPASKLDLMREEMKLRKESNSNSNSPQQQPRSLERLSSEGIRRSVGHGGLEGVTEEGRPASFAEKMLRFDYANLLAKRPLSNADQQGGLLEYSENDDDPLGFAAGEVPKPSPPKGGRNDKAGRGPARSPPKSPESQQNERSKQSLAANKPLTPLISGKLDVYAKTQREENRKEDLKKRADSRGKSREKPQLDNRNSGYKPAHTKEPKQFVKDHGKPNLSGVASSQYGVNTSKRSPSNSKIKTPRTVTSGTNIQKRDSPSPAPPRRPSRGPTDVRSLVADILSASKARNAPHDVSALGRSRRDNSHNRCTLCIT